MDIITYRGKTKNTGELVFGDLLRVRSKTFSYSPNNQIETLFIKPLNNDEKYEIEPTTLGMLTGCKDKKSKDIYSGDRVNVYTNNKTFSGRIVYESAAFWIQYDNPINNKTRELLSEFVSGFKDDYEPNDISFECRLILGSVEVI